MSTGPKRTRRVPSKNGSAATKVADAAVRRALVESRGDILAFVRQRLGNGEEAEEVLQRFSLRALERGPDLGDIHAMRGWLGQVLVSTIVNHQRRAVRRRQREARMEQIDIESLVVEPDVGTDGAVCACLYNLLPTLKADYSEVIWRADILGEPHDRIAASLGTTLNNVTVRIHRGRRALEQRLEEMCLTCPVHDFLDCRCETLLDARRLDRPANYALLRITEIGDACWEDCVDPNGPPVTMVDPCGGHGPGIGASSAIGKSA
jgi:RNA polymerase sigma-70 factor (ECF subfamily)